MWKLEIEIERTKITLARHFSEPKIPTIPGIETFPGSVMHSHEYRKPDEFAGKRVIVLGAASSGIDIGIELAGKASHVYLSHNRQRWVEMNLHISRNKSDNKNWAGLMKCHFVHIDFRLIGPLPRNMTQVSGVEKISDKTFILRDGSNVQADSFVYCTGYKYSFPFFHHTCSIKVDENYVSPLYKHLINVEHPSMCIVGVPTTVIPFALFNTQVHETIYPIPYELILKSNWCSSRCLERICLRFFF